MCSSDLGALPSVSLVGQVGVGADGSGATVGSLSAPLEASALGPDFGASIGLQVSWNPFDLFQTRDRVAEARLAQQQVQASEESERAVIRADVRKAASDVNLLRQRAPLMEARVALARDNLQIVQGLYAQGSATILDLFDAQSAFRQARAAGASLQVQLVVAETDLLWLLGEDF